MRALSLTLSFLLRHFCFSARFLAYMTSCWPAQMLQVPQASPEAVDLISRLCQWDPAKRPTALEALQHPFFQVWGLPAHVGRAGHGQHARLHHFMVFCHQVTASDACP